MQGAKRNVYQGIRIFWCLIIGCSLLPVAFGSDSEGPSVSAVPTEIAQEAPVEEQIDTPAQTAPTAGRAASRIEVSGNQRIDVSTIQSLLSFQPHQRVSAGELDKSVKALFKTGYFSDVKIEQHGGVLKVKVVENPVVNQIAFEGNNEI